MGFSLSNHKNSKRVKVINFQESDLDKLIFPFKKHTITSLEYKPFSRFTLAKVNLEKGLYSNDVIVCFLKGNISLSKSLS